VAASNNMRRDLSPSRSRPYHQQKQQNPYRSGQCFFLNREF